MKDSKLAKLLQLLKNKDLRQVQKMLQSPFFTTKDSLLKLFSILRKHHPDFDHKNIKKEILFKKIFGTDIYSDVKMRNLLSDLTRIVEDYLILQELEDNDIQRRRLLLKIYTKQSNRDLFLKEANKLSSEIDLIPFRDIEFYRETISLNELRLEFMESKDLINRHQLLIDNLAHQEWLYKLTSAKIQTELLSFHKMSKFEDESRGKIKDNIIFQIYSELKNLYDTKKELYFNNIKKLLFNNLNVIRPGYQLEFLTHLINYSISNMKIDDLKYNCITLDLYQFGLAHLILLQNNRITDNTFLNIVIIGSKAKEFNWVESFMKEYDRYLLSDKKEEIIILAKSYFYFHKSEVEKSIELLRNSTFKSPFHNLAARVQLLRSYYELFLKDLTYFDVLIAQCMAFEKMIQRNNFYSSDYIQSALNFSKVIRKMAICHLNGKNSSVQKQELLEILNNQKITISRSWLIKKVKAIEE